MVGRVFGVNVVEKRVVGKRRGKARPGTQQQQARPSNAAFPSLFWKTHPTNRQRPFAGCLPAIRWTTMLPWGFKQKCIACIASVCVPRCPGIDKIRIKQSKPSCILREALEMC